MPDPNPAPWRDLHPVARVVVVVVVVVLAVLGVLVAATLTGLLYRLAAGAWTGNGWCT